MNEHYLKALFEPRSVALVGASDNPSKVGGRVLDNLLAGGFKGPLFAVNPRHDRVKGQRCFASVADIPEPVDLAVIATPARTVPEVIEACGKRGTRAAVVITAGFREAGAEGAALERELLEKAGRHGVRLLGPNCVGIMRPPLGLNATFARGQALAGSIALVSQSGALCTAMLDWATAMGVGFSSVISLGGTSDLDFGEVLDYLAADAATRQILVYVEGVRDGRRFVGSLRAAARAKPIIVMKSGRHPVGSRAAVSHTGAIVGRDDVFDAVVRRAGVVRVKTAGEMVAAALALASEIRPPGERLAIVTNGGGPGVMAADRATDLGLPLAELAPATLAVLQEHLPPNWSHGNPVDLIGDAPPDRYRAAVRACLDDPGVDGVLAILTPQAMTEPEAAAEAVIEARAESSKPVIACWMGRASVDSARATFRRARVPVYRLPEPAVEAFAHLAQHYRNQRLLLEVPAPLVHHEAPDLAAARRIVAAALSAGRSVLGVAESKDFLAAFRIPGVRSVPAADAEEAAAVASRIGFPVVLKLSSPDITHKSDVGGVLLGLPDAKAVREACEAMLARIARDHPGVRVDGVTVERMVTAGHGRELILGITSDEVFGPAITFGAGGIAVEVLRDLAIALPPLNARLIEDLVGSTRVSKMLGAFRHLPAVDRGAVAEALLRVSEIACAIPEVAELDINPLLADASGVLALDARVVLRSRPAGELPFARLAIHPYPDELEREERLRGGERVVVRPIRPEDARLERDFVAGLSDQSRWLRFRSALRTLTPEMLARFTQIDYDREMALVAIEGAAQRQVAVCRYVTLPDGRACEFAIVVGDDWQRRGLGGLMMRRLIEVARARGLGEMVGWVLAENVAMLGMMSRLGFSIAVDPEDRLLRRVTLALT